MRNMIILLLTLGSSLVALAQGAHYDNSPGDLTGGGTIAGDLDMDGNDLLDVEDLRLTCASCPALIYTNAATTDASPPGISIRSGDAYPLATGTRVYGANTCALGGSGSRKAVVADYTACTGDNIGVVINGVTNTLTAGTHWTAATSNEATCASICTAIDALVGVSCSECSSASVPVVIDPGCNVVKLTTSDAACVAVTNYSDGQLLVGPGDGAFPAIATPADKDSGFYWFQDGYWYYSGNGSPSVYFYSGGMGMGTNKTLGLYGTGTGARLINLSAVPTAIGTYPTNLHGLGSGSAGTGGSFIVNGDSYLDGLLSLSGIMRDVGATCAAGDVAIDTGGGTVEFCYCRATDTWGCVPLTSGPAD